MVDIPFLSAMFGNDPDEAAPLAASVDSGPGFLSAFTNALDENPALAQALIVGGTSLAQGNRFGTALGDVGRAAKEQSKIDAELKQQAIENAREEELVALRGRDIGTKEQANIIASRKNELVAASAAAKASQKAIDDNFGNAVQQYNADVPKDSLTGQRPVTVDEYFLGTYLVQPRGIVNPHDPVIAAQINFAKDANFTIDKFLREGRKAELEHLARSAIIPQANRLGLKGQTYISIINKRVKQFEREQQNESNLIRSGG